MDCITYVSLFFKGRVGSGIVIARDSNSESGWTAPSAIGTASIGMGAQVGGEIVEIVMLLNSQQAVESFKRGGNLTLGTNISIALGPTGRDAEASLAVSSKSISASIYSYSKAKGFFAGISIEGTVLVERKDTNAKFYGRKVRAGEILSYNSPVENPAYARELYDILNAFIGITASEFSSSTINTSFKRSFK